MQFQAPDKPPFKSHRFKIERARLIQYPESYIKWQKHAKDKRVPLEERARWNEVMHLQTDDYQQNSQESKLNKFSQI